MLLVLPDYFYFFFLLFWIHPRTLSVLDTYSGEGLCIRMTGYVYSEIHLFIIRNSFLVFFSCHPVNGRLLLVSSLPTCLIRLSPLSLSFSPFLLWRSGRSPFLLPFVCKAWRVDSCYHQIPVCVSLLLFLSMFAFVLLIWLVACSLFILLKRALCVCDVSLYIQFQLEKKSRIITSLHDQLAKKEEQLYELT